MKKVHFHHLKLCILCKTLFQFLFKTSQHWRKTRKQNSILWDNIKLKICRSIGLSIREIFKYSFLSLSVCLLLFHHLFLSPCLSISHSLSTSVSLLCIQLFFVCLSVSHLIFSHLSTCLYSFLSISLYIPSCLCLSYSVPVNHAFPMNFYLPVDLFAIGFSIIYLSNLYHSLSFLVHFLCVHLAISSLLYILLIFTLIFWCELNPVSWYFHFLGESVMYSAWATQKLKQIHTKG